MLHILKGIDMQITSSIEAGAFVKLLRESRGISRKELSEDSGIPLRTIYAIENGELNNLSLDRLVALLTVLHAHLEVRVTDVDSEKDAEVNRLVKLASTGTLDAGRWGLLP